MLLLICCACLPALPAHAAVTSTGNADHAV
jgi:hypothetical protein